MWNIQGQDHLLKQLEPGLQQGRLSHAYLLVGPPHVGKMTLAVALAQGVNCEKSSPALSLFADEAPEGASPCGRCTQCRRIAQSNHADVKVVGIRQRDEDGPTRTVIGIDDVKEALHQVNLKPFEGACTVIIFDGAELMSEEAANALLKVLEEPPPQVLILLLTANEDALLSTIKSRCRRLDLRPVARERIAETLQATHGADPDLAERLARLSRGCLGWAIGAVQDPQRLEQREADLEQLQEVYQGALEQRFSYAAELATRFQRDRDAVREVLFLWLGWWRDLVLIKEGSEEYVQNLEHLDRLHLQASQLGIAEIVRAIRALNGTLEALDSNASPRLALEVLMLELPPARMPA
jgi:DNA polymerase III subunit delta'